MLLRERTNVPLPTKAHKGVGHRRAPRPLLSFPFNTWAARDGRRGGPQTVSLLFSGMTRWLRRLGWAFATFTTTGLAGRALAAQVVGREGLRTIEGARLDFSPTGGWRVRARAVAQRRKTVTSAGRFDYLNAERGPGAAALAVSGSFFLPSALLQYADTDSLSLLPPAVYDSMLYGVVAPAGRPYTLRSLYGEMSAGLLDLQGTVFGWTKTDSTLGELIAACPSSGGLCGQALLQLTTAFRSVLARIDTVVDFGAFDNDGPDDIPNSPDDDGVVDIIQFVQPVIGAECGGPGYWAHKSTFSSNDPFGGPFVTNDTTPAGAAIRIDSYYITSGVGGIDCDDPGQIMGVGLSAHELGHGLALPDLYDTGGTSNGIGEWGLMGSAMYTSLGSPGHFGAWSKERLGWVAVAELVGAGAYRLGPTLLGDSVYLLRPQVSNPRGEYFLLENKQPVLADTANLLTGGRAGPKYGGLVVWHVDSQAVAQREAANTVNSGNLHGVKVVQADGLGQLEQFVTVGNRGDAGDPFPGDSNRTRYASLTTPPAVLNYDGSCPGFQLDSIGTSGTPGVVAFVLNLGPPIVVRASDTAAMITVDGTKYSRFVECLDPAQTHQIGIDSVQLTPDGRTEFGYLGWSDGGARNHAISGLGPGDSVVATVRPRYRVQAQIVGDGAVTSTSGADVLVGAFFDDLTTDTLVAAPGAGSVLDAWGGDTTAVGDTLVVQVTRPLDLSATFAPILTFVDTLPPSALVGSEYSYAFSSGGGLPLHSYVLAGGQLPPGLVLGSGGTVSGVVSAEGSFVASIAVRSGSQRVARAVAFEAVAPVVDVEDAITELLGLEATLTVDERRYLDFTGNANGQFDLGDFLAWIERLDPQLAREAMQAWRGR